MRVTVTGGAGFIGSHLVDRLLAEGHEVQVVDDLSTGLRKQVPAAAEFVESCVTSAEAAAEVRRYKPQLLVHLAAQIDVRVSVNEPARDALVNVVGTVAMAEAARLGGCLERVVFASSSAVYGVQEGNLADESHPLAPISAYGAAKRCGEVYLGQFGRLHDLPWVALRFANVYGPRQNPHGEAGVSSIFARLLRLGEPLTVFGDGSVTRDYLYVGDVVDGLIRAAMAPRLDTAINLGTEESTSVSDLITALEEAAERRAEVRHEAPRAGDVPHSTLSAAKARSALGWRAGTTLSEGLKQLWASLDVVG